MGKASRNDRRAAGPKIYVRDAEHLVKLGRLCARPAPGDLWQHTAAVVEAWEQDRVVLRADPDLIGAFVTTDRTSPLLPDQLARFSFRSIALSFAEPLITETASGTSTFPGFFAAGVRWTPDAETGGPARLAPIPDADGVEIVWPSSELGPNGVMLGSHRMIWWFEEDAPEPANTLSLLLERLRTRHRLAPGDTFDMFDNLIPTAVLVLLYLTADDPDLEQIPPQRLVRPQQLHRVRVANLGWRVGANLRAAVALRSTGGSSGGWTIGPHMRSAHFRRSRVATRDGDQIIGDIHGTYQIDWHYVLHWIPPTPVNCGPDGPAPVVRSIKRSTSRRAESPGRRRLANPSPSVEPLYEGEYGDVPR